MSTFKRFKGGLGNDRGRGGESAASSAVRFSARRVERMFGSIVDIEFNFSGAGFNLAIIEFGYTYSVSVSGTTGLTILCGHRTVFRFDKLISRLKSMATSTLEFLCASILIHCSERIRLNLAY